MFLVVLPRSPRGTCGLTHTRPVRSLRLRACSSQPGPATRTEPPPAARVRPWAVGPARPPGRPRAPDTSGRGGPGAPRGWTELIPEILLTEPWEPTQGTCGRAGKVDTPARGHRWCMVTRGHAEKRRVTPSRTIDGGAQRGGPRGLGHEAGPRAVGRRGSRVDAAQGVGRPRSGNGSNSLPSARRSLGDAGTVVKGTSRLTPKQSEPPSPVHAGLGPRAPRTCALARGVGGAPGAHAPSPPRSGAPCFSGAGRATTCRAPPRAPASPTSRGAGPRPSASVSAPRGGGGLRLLQGREERRPRALAGRV